MRTIKDYILSRRMDVVEELRDLISAIPEGEMLTQQQLAAMLLHVASNATEIYNNGFEDALKLIESCDVTFLKRKIPPHLK